MVESIYQDKDGIRKCFQRLMDRGYICRVIDQYEIVFMNKAVNIHVMYERYDDSCAVQISFSEDLLKRRTYDIGWIHKIEKGVAPAGDGKLEMVCSIADFLDERYDDVTNEGFCKRMEAQYRQYILSKS